MEKLRDFTKKRGTTLFLRFALLGIAVIVLFFSSFMIIDVYSHWAKQSPELAGWQYPIIFVIVTVVITFFVALGQIWKLLGLVDKNRAFSQASVDAMRPVRNLVAT
jgi:hypothetical protein